MTGRTWTYHDFSTTMGGAPAASLHDFTSPLRTQVGFTPSDVTVQRIVGHLGQSAPGGATAYDSQKFFWGIIPVDGDAATAGAFPEPWADSVRWMWTHGGETWVPDNPSATLHTPLIPDHIALPHIDIQVNRRMRGRNQELHLVGYDDGGITGAVNVYGTLRVLWKLNA